MNENKSNVRPSTLDVPIPNNKGKIELLVLKKIKEKQHLLSEEEKVIKKYLPAEKTTNQDNLELIFATALIEKGFKTREIFKIIGWSGFEKITGYLLQNLDMEVYYNFRFRNIFRERREIDVLAFRKPIILAIDCKNWLTSQSHLSSLKKAGEKQKQRAIELFDILPEISLYTPIKHWDKAYLIPVIITALEHDIELSEDVFVVPLMGLREFVANILAYERLFKLKWINFGD